ncbi:hypothetical protein QBC32DRAFT_314512 [Pseudoneurospora amorphoporcata]|uniref:MSP domain-containing protein n=1 Tax=Pseudoneurospora amorphoporcata TaxID=241081 RepID=A0AAN6NTY7_9PEZI|nr:hypothetical protein QBC32DRAFT_314512 [Pseudoneurospora amorphoporcata]
MSAEIEPPKLGFGRPFTEVAEQILTIRNRGSRPIIYRIKTNMPNHYSADPDPVLSR